MDYGKYSVDDDYDDDQDDILRALKVFVVYLIKFNRTFNLDNYCIAL